MSKTRNNHQPRCSNASKIKRSMALAGLITFSSFSASYGQTYKLQGNVTDLGDSTLKNVVIYNKSTNERVESSSSGNFFINASKGDTLSFRAMGFINQNYIVNDSSFIAIAMNPISKSMDEIIVVGYGSQRKSDITGAIATVSPKTLNAMPVSDVNQGLQGRISGMSVTNNGAPGTTPIVQIRGISSINYSSSPLYVVDGVPGADMGSFDSRDVESIQVLKDASAAAIYGSRATNGVIIITTKRGSVGKKLNVTYDGYVGFQNAWRKLDLLNTDQYLKYERALNGAAGIASPPRLDPTSFNAPIYQGASQTYAQTNTNWQDAYFKTGVITQHDVSVSGGSEKSRFYTSAGYFNQTGITPRVGFQRGNFRINSEHKISKAITFGENLYLAYTKQNVEASSGNRTNLVNVIRSLPYLPVTDPTTPSGYRAAMASKDGSDPSNPVEQALLVNQNTVEGMNLLGSAYLDIKFTSWLKFRSTFGLRYANTFQHNYTPIYNDSVTNQTLSSIQDITNRSTTPLFTEQLTFDKYFGEHHLNATAVYEQQEFKSYSETATGNQATNEVQTLQGATNTSISSYRSTAFLLSYIGRINYDYRGKYLLSAAVRRDGLSIWSPGNKYANFPSVSAGWRIDQENFMKNSALISELKLRAGWGRTGLNAIGILGSNYPYQAIVVANGATYPYNNTITSGNASYYNTIANSNLNWEITDQSNVGLDLGLWNNKFTLTTEYWTRKTNNLILNIPTPGSIGYNESGAQQNIASMKNYGVDVQIGYNKMEGAFKWNVTGIVSVVRNKVLSLNNASASIYDGGDADFGGGDPITKTAAGHPAQSFFGYVTDGIFQNQQEVSNSAYQTANTAPGDIRFKDLDGNDTINSNDRTYLGSYIPKFSYSLNYSANYKNFDFSVYFQGVYGNKIFNASRIITEGMQRLFNAGVNVLNAWTPENTNTNIPRAISGDPNQNARPSTRWIESGSFLRVKNLMLGYTLKPSSFSWMTDRVQSLRFYVSSQNLFTFTGYKGYDPEVGSKNGSLTNGIDYGQYPAARSFQVGVQANF